MTRLRAERSVKATWTVHVLSVLCLLLLSHAINVIARHFGVLGASKSGEPHTLAHQAFKVVVSDVDIHVHLIFSTTWPLVFRCAVCL